MKTLFSSLQCLALGGLAVVGIVAWMPAQATDYTYEIIEYPGSEGNTFGWGLNNVGTMVLVAGDNAVYDTRMMTFTALPQISDVLPDYESGSMLNINDNGTLVGTGFLCTDGFDPGTGFCNGGVNRGAILDRQGNFTTFAHPDYENTYGRAISNRGVVAGYAEKRDPGTGDYESVGILYDPKDGSFVSFLPSTVTPTIAQGTNNQGQTVGYYRESVSPFVRYAFLRENNGDVSLLQVNGSVNGRARDISDFGAIAGDFADPVDGVTKGFVVCLDGSAESVSPEGFPLKEITVDEMDVIEVPIGLLSLPPDFEIFSTIPEGIDNQGRVSGIVQAFNFNTFDLYVAGFLATPVEKGACK